MNTYHNQMTGAQFREACICPATGSLLPDYILDLLEDTVAEKVEEHLVNCRSCKETYLTILRIRGAARRKDPARRAANSSEDEGPDDQTRPDDADLLVEN